MPITYENNDDAIASIINKIVPNETISFIQSDEDENNFLITTNGYDNNNNLKISKLSLLNNYEIRLNKSLVYNNDIILLDRGDEELKIQVPQHDELWLDNHRFTEIWMSYSVYEDTVLSD